jgi:hypothetical protein
MRQDTTITLSRRIYFKRRRGVILKYWIIILLCTLIINGCSNNITSNDSEILQATATNDEARPNETFMMDLRLTLNLSYKIFHAMNEKDYKYIQSVSAPAVKVNEDNTIEFLIANESQTTPFIKSVNFKNLEYWGAGYLSNNNEFSLEFARFENDSHGTIYMDFIKNENGEWLFTSMLTNA